MNNYVYIIAGLPDFTPDWRQGEKSLDEYLEQKRLVLESLRSSDNRFAFFPRIYDFSPFRTLDCIKLLLRHMYKFIYFSQTLEFS